jgi:hypothetical protein
MSGSIIIGKLSQIIIRSLSLPYPIGTPIWLSPSNIAHMTLRHPGAYSIYGKDIPLIILSPEYVGITPKDGSIEFVRQNKSNGDHIKVAVRSSGNGVLFVRSIYIINSMRVVNFIKKGQLKKV